MSFDIGAFEIHRWYCTIICYSF